MSYFSYVSPESLGISLEGNSPVSDRWRKRTSNCTALLWCGESKVGKGLVGSHAPELESTRCIPLAKP